MDGHVETERLDNTHNAQMCVCCCMVSSVSWWDTCVTASRQMCLLWITSDWSRTLRSVLITNSAVAVVWCVRVGVCISVCLISATMGVYCKTGYPCFLQQRLSLGHTQTYTPPCLGCYVFSQWLFSVIQMNTCSMISFFCFYACQNAS